MVLNLIKTYPELLDIAWMSIPQRKTSLMGVFKKDIADNEGFRFNGKQIRPIKKDGIPGMETLFDHLTTREDKDEKGKKLGTRSFEMARSERLHWVRYHVELAQKGNGGIDVFSYEDRIKGRGDVIRTYIYNETQEYVVILEPQKSGLDYYLITAYHLNEPGSRKQVKSKQKKRLDQVY